jgi:hypothetical protein
VQIDFGLMEKGTLRLALETKFLPLRATPQKYGSGIVADIVRLALLQTQGIEGYLLVVQENDGNRLSTYKWPEKTRSWMPDSARAVVFSELDEDERSLIGSFAHRTRDYPLPSGLTLRPQAKSQNASFETRAWSVEGHA